MRKSRRVGKLYALPRCSDVARLFISALLRPTFSRWRAVDSKEKEPRRVSRGVRSGRSRTTRGRWCFSSSSLHRVTFHFIVTDKRVLLHPATTRCQSATAMHNSLGFFACASSLTPTTAMTTATTTTGTTTRGCAATAHAYAYIMHTRRRISDCKAETPCSNYSERNFRSHGILLGYVTRSVLSRRYALRNILFSRNRLRRARETPRARNAARTSNSLRVSLTPNCPAKQRDSSSEASSAR